MALTVDYIYNYSLFLINKTQSSTYTPNDFFYNWNAEQRAYMADLLGRFQNRSNGKEGSNTGLIENETILSSLAPFTKSVNLVVTAGNANRPADYVYGLAMRSNGFTAYAIKKGQISSVSKSVIDPPSIAANEYYFTEYATFFTILPSTATSVDLDYVSDCIDVVWGYNLVSGIPVYNAGTSTQPLWKNAEIIEITKRTLRGMGVHYSSQDFENFGNQTIATGN